MNRFLLLCSLLLPTFCSATDFTGDVGYATFEFKVTANEINTVRTSCNSGTAIDFESYYIARLYIYGTSFTFDSYEECIQAERLLNEVACHRLTALTFTLDSEQAKVLRVHVTR